MADEPVETQRKQEESPVKFFEGCECLTNYKRLELKFKKLEELIVNEKSEDIKKLERKLDQLIDENTMAKQEIRKLSEENKKLRERIQSSEKEVAKAVDMKDEIEEVKNGWNVNKQEIVNFRKLVEDQKKEEEKSRSKWMVDAIKHNERLVRKAVEKNRCVIIFGDYEEEEKDRGKREAARAERVTKILDKIVDSGVSWVNQIEEIRKIGAYKKDGKSRPERPIRVKFNSEKITKEILGRTWKLNGQEGYESIYVRKDLNEEERVHLAELKKDVAGKNGERTEEQEKEFFWRVKDMKIVKWKIRQLD